MFLWLVKCKTRSFNLNLYLCFQISDLMNLPDDINFIMDELDFARSEAEESGKTCEEMYSFCPSKSIMQIVKRVNKMLR